MIVQSVRRIATELRPEILDLSLVATIEWQLQEVQTRSGIRGKLVSAPEDKGTTVTVRLPLAPDTLQILGASQ